MLPPNVAALPPVADSCDVPVHDLAIVHKVTTTTTSAVKVSIALFAIPSASYAHCRLGRSYDDMQGASQLSRLNHHLGDSCQYMHRRRLRVRSLHDSCSKTGLISHTCEKPSSGCTERGGGSFGIYAAKGIGDGYTSCQAVNAGDTADFLMKDRDGNCDTGASGVATCKALEDEDPTNDSCTGNVDKECI
jgi:hypothetical protein